MHVGYVMVFDDQRAGKFRRPFDYDQLVDLI